MFGERLNTLLKQNKMTQTRLGELVGLSSPAISMILKNERKPSYEVLEKICKVLNTSPSYMMGFEEQITDSDRALLQAFKTMATAQTSNNQNKNIPEQTQDR